MALSVHAILLGAKRPVSCWYREITFAFFPFVVTTAAYAAELFSISGGVVWIPLHAALVGTVAGCWIGYSRQGLLSAWLFTYASLFGYLADHIFFGLSGRPPSNGWCTFSGPTDSCFWRSRRSFWEQSRLSPARSPAV